MYIYVHLEQYKYLGNIVYKINKFLYTYPIQKECQAAGSCLWIMEQLSGSNYILNIKRKVYRRPSHIEGLLKVSALYTAGGSETSAALGFETERENG